MLLELAHQCLGTQVPVLRIRAFQDFVEQEEDRPTGCDGIDRPLQSPQLGVNRDALAPSKSWVRMLV